MPAGPIGIDTGKVAKAALPFPNTDLTIRRREAVCRFPAFLARAAEGMLRDKRDLLLLEALVSILIIVPASASLVFLAPWWQLKVALGLLHVPFVFVVFAARFILGMHYWSHAPLGTVWAKHVTLGPILQAIPTVVMAPFFGIPAGLYHLHHIAMHHRDNNMSPTDLSSTMPYQRNSILGFAHYWLRFTFFALIELPFHSLRNGNMRLFAQGVGCSTFWVAKMLFLWRIDSVATTFVFIIPFFVATFVLMLGNWSQHIFVDPDAYEDGVAKDDDLVNYRLTYNTINSPENALSFNDGYHVVHHRWASLHWSEMPRRFMEDIETHARQDTLVFKDADPMAVGLAVMSGNWKWLTDRYVHYGQTKTPRTPEQIRAELERRLVPIHVPAKAKAA